MENEEIKNEEEITSSTETTEATQEELVVEEQKVNENNEVDDTISQKNISETVDSVSNENIVQETNTVESNNPSVVPVMGPPPQFMGEQPQFEMAPPRYEEVQMKPKVIRTDSYFDGGLLELIGWRFLAFLITCVTLGIAYPWAKCMLYNYQFKHTVYNGKRLKFEGTGGDLFVNMFKWAFFTLITCGIYSFFIPVSKTKWVISNLHFEDEDHITGESYFDGNTFQLIGVNIVCILLTLISFGLLYPFAVCYRLKWINKHAIINRKRLIFKGKSLNLWGKYLLWIFLTMITFGIFGLWLGIKMLKWQTKNTSIRMVGEKEVKDTITYIILIPLIIGALALFIGLIANIPKMFSDNGEEFEFSFKYLNPFYVIANSKVDRPKREITMDGSYCPSDFRYDKKLHSCYSYVYEQKECSANNNYYVEGMCMTQAYGSSESIKEMIERITLIKNGKLPKGEESVAEYKKLKNISTTLNKTTSPSKAVPETNKTSNSSSDVILLSKNVKYAFNSDAFQCNKCFSQSFINKLKKAKGYYVTKATNSYIEYSQIVALSNPYNSTKYYGTSYRSQLFNMSNNVAGGGGENLKLTAKICKQHNLNCK